MYIKVCTTRTRGRNTHSVYSLDTRLE